MKKLPRSLNYPFSDFFYPNKSIGIIIPLLHNFS